MINDTLPDTSADDPAMLVERMRVQAAAGEASDVVALADRLLADDTVDDEESMVAAAEIVHHNGADPIRARRLVAHAIRAGGLAKALPTLARLDPSTVRSVAQQWTTIVTLSATHNDPHA